MAIPSHRPHKTKETKGHELDNESTEAMFYGATFGIGLAAALCRVVLEHHHRDWRDLIAISVQGGLWSFGVVSVCGHYFGDLTSNPYLGLGVASIVGLGGKEQDKYLRHIMAILASKIGLPTPPPVETFENKEPGSKGGDTFR